MSLFPAAFGRNRVMRFRRFADAFVHEVAEQSLVGVRNRLRADVSAMSAAELRGYVRARAIRIVRQQTERWQSERGQNAALPDWALAQALERTTHLATRQLIAGPLVVARARIAG
jgi:hypothetical protein